MPVPPIISQQANFLIDLIGFFSVITWLAMKQSLEPDIHPPPEGLRQALMPRSVVPFVEQAFVAVLEIPLEHSAHILRESGIIDLLIRLEIPAQCPAIDIARPNGDPFIA